VKQSTIATGALAEGRGIKVAESSSNGLAADANMCSIYREIYDESEIKALMT
jgi:hypothetical protein